MTKSTNPDAPKSVEDILHQFDSRKDTLEAFCYKTKALIEDILQDANIQYQSVQARVKDREKLRQKYLDPKKSYKQLDDITDQAALRIITYYPDEVDRVAAVIKREFDVSLPDSVDKRETAPDRFGYYALNYVCTHLRRRTDSVEYKKFAGVRCEIQITSVLRHAWSEMEHDWYDRKDSYPDAIKRRFYLLAALLEIAESDFLELRKSKADYHHAVAVQVEAMVPNIPLDAVSLKSFIEHDDTVKKLDAQFGKIIKTPPSGHASDPFMEHLLRIAEFVGFTTIQDIRDALIKHQTQVAAYLNNMVPIWESPVTQATSYDNGLCIYHLLMMLLASQGSHAIKAFYDALEISPSADKFEQQAAIAAALIK